MNALDSLPWIRPPLVLYSRSSVRLSGAQYYHTATAGIDGTYQVWVQDTPCTMHTFLHHQAHGIPATYFSYGAICTIQHQEAQFRVTQSCWHQILVVRHHTYYILVILQVAVTEDRGMPCRQVFNCETVGAPVMICSKKVSWYRPNSVHTFFTPQREIFALSFRCTVETVAIKSCKQSYEKIIKATNNRYLQMKLARYVNMPPNWWP